MNNTELLITVLICAAVTAGLRFAPFILFAGRKEPPQFITWLGNKLPRAVMAMLVIYCLKDLNFTGTASYVRSCTCRSCGYEFPSRCQTADDAIHRERYARLYAPDSHNGLTFLRKKVLKGIAFCMGDVV